jgi:beta-glucosidase
VERSALRLLAAQVRSYAAREPQDPGPEIMADGEARALAREVAARAMVLLKNDAVDGAPLLPLDPAQVTSIALIGRLAVAPNQGDLGSSSVRPPSGVTPLDGLRAAFPGAEISLVTDDDPVAAAAAARSAQVAIVVAGFDMRDEGEYVGPDTMTDPALIALYPPAPPGALEQLTGGAGSSAESSLDEGNVMMGSDSYGGDRAGLRLRAVDEEIVRAVAEANPRTVVAVVAAGTVLTEAWRHDVPAVVMMWYAGMEGGHALADVLTGAHNPSGRLPFAVPTSAEHLPAFDRNATAVSYDRYHGQRLLDRLGVAPAFPHGFGLSYTTFVVADARVTSPLEGGVRLGVTVRNTGERAGHHVVQVYGRTTSGPYAGELLLAGFAVVEVAAGGSATVDVEVSFTALAAWDAVSRRRVLPSPADVVLEIGSYAHDPDAVVVTAVLA